MCVTSDLSLDHCWPLCPEHLHCLKDINYTFIAHSLQDNAKGDEDSGPAYPGTRNTSIMSINQSVSQSINQDVTDVLDTHIDRMVTLHLSSHGAFLYLRCSCSHSDASL